MLSELLAYNADAVREYHGPVDMTPLILLESDTSDEGDTAGGFEADPVVIPVYDDVNDEVGVKNFYFATLTRRWRGFSDEFPAYSKTLFVRASAVTEEQLRKTICITHGDQRYRIAQWVRPHGQHADWRLLLSPTERP